MPRVGQYYTFHGRLSDGNVMLNNELHTDEQRNWNVMNNLCKLCNELYIKWSCNM